MNYIFHHKNGRCLRSLLQGFLLLAWLLPGQMAGAASPAGAVALPPNWTIDPLDFEFNMSMVVQVKYNGVASNAPGNMVGAFVGNELRGVGTPVTAGSSTYFFTTVYSNLFVGETVYFKVYYAPNDKVYATANTVTFRHHLSLGTFDAPFMVNINPNEDFPPQIAPIPPDTTLQGIPFAPVALNNYLISLDGDPVNWSAAGSANLNVSLVNNVLTVTPVSPSWAGTDSVRIIVTENTVNHLADTTYARFTVLPDYGPPVWQTIPSQSILQGSTFTTFDLDNYLTFNGPCHGFDYDVTPFSGTVANPAWPSAPPGVNPMNITARVLFANELLSGPGAKLAAFVNGNLAGTATPTGSGNNITYQLHLANVGSGAIQFRFYDAANQYLYQKTSTLNFTPGASVGTVSTPYVVQLSPIVPVIASTGVVQMNIVDPTWTGVFPVNFIVWDCLLPAIRRDTTTATFTIVADVSPTIISPPTVNFEENACTQLYDTQTTDPNNSEGNGLTYSLSGGADIAKFSINPQTGILSWAVGFTPDFENPQDADGNNQYEVTIKVTNLANQSDEQALVVTVTNQQPEPFVASINGGISPICTAASVNLQATGGVSYQWSNGSSQSAILVTAAGTYSVTATSSGGCTATAAVVVAPLPHINAAGSSTPVCQGSPVQLSSTPTGGTTPYATFAWTGPNGFSSGVEDPAAFPAVPASAGVYTVTLTDAAGCTASGTTTIAVSANVAPTISAASNTPVCVGSAIALTSNPSGGSGNGYTFLWAGPPNYAATGQNPTPFTAAAGNSGVYTVTVTDNAGCTGVATTTVQVNTRPTVVASSNSPVSVGANIVLNAAASAGSGSGYTYQWAGPNGYSSAQAQPTIAPATLAANGVYTVTVTDSKGCTGTATTTVVVVACPTITAAQVGSTCLGGTITLSSTPAGGATPYAGFAWAGPNNFSSTLEDPLPFAAVQAAAGTYTVTVTDALGCTATATVTVVLNGSPVITANNNGPMCQGSTVVLTSTPSGGSGVYSSFQWTGPNGFSAAVEDPAPFTGAPANSGIYTVTVTDNKGCSATTTTSLLVSPKPSIGLAANSPLCVGAVFNLTTTPGGGATPYSFNWTGPNGFTSTQEDPTPFAVQLVNGGTYQVTVTNSTGCSNTASTTLIVSNLPAPTISATSNSPVCAGQNLVLNSTATGGTGVFTAYSWAGPNNYSSAQEDPTPFTVAANASGVYTVTVTDSQNCKGTTSISVTVGGPTVAPTSNSPVCPGATIELHAGGVGQIYTWSGPNNYSAATANPTILGATIAASGTYYVTVNDNGCIATGSVTVTVVDNTPPTITCPANATINVNANCAATIGSIAPAALNDNCNANPAVTQTPGPATVLTGHNTVQTITLTANDGNGNTASCSLTVTLKDVTPPSITCPANVTVNASANCTGQLGTYNAAALSDNCNPAPAMTQSPAAGTFLVGHNATQTVTLTANDGNGNTASCSLTVTLKDVTPPTITCPPNVTMNADANCSALVGSYSAVTLSDNCNPAPAVTQSPAATTVITGHNTVQTVTLTANDGNGNTAACTLTVTLKDITKPTITCPPNVTINANANCSGAVGAYNPVTLSDNCNPNPAVVQTPGPATTLTGHNAVQTITLTANDGNGNTASCSLTVTLKDVTPPSITCPANVTINANANCSGLLGAYSAATLSDNCNPNPAVTQSPAATTVLTGHNTVQTVTLTANDGNGNTASCTLTVTLKDVTPPSITCPPNVTVNANASCSGVVGAFNAVTLGDNCNPTPAVTQSPAPTTVITGHNTVQTVTLTANDGNGNTASCSLTVTLKDVTPPTITCPPNVTLNVNANCAAAVGAYNPVALNDNCNPTPAVTQSPAATTVLTGHNTVQTVTLTANDGNGNTASCSLTVTLKDVTPPTVVCKPFTAALNAAGNATITTANVFQSGADNCGTVNQVSVVPNAFNCSNLGVNTVVLTVNDGNGNTASCNATVTVVDNIPPTMSCNQIIVPLSAAGTASVTAAQINNNSTDNCTLVSLSLTPTTFTCNNLGGNTVTLTGVDQSGNTASCNGLVIIIDNIPPTILCKNATLNLDLFGNATLNVADINNGSFDNCTIVSLILSQTAFNCSNLGNNNVTLIGTDQSGNSAQCTAVVTVLDLIAPVAKCKNVTAVLGPAGAVTVPAASVNNGTTDNCNFTLSLTPATFTCANVGANTVTLKATDSSGNSSTCSAVITVKDLTPPTAICQNPTIYLDSQGKAVLTPQQVDGGSTDNCGIVSRTINRTTFNCTKVAAGQFVILTLKDAAGNTSTCQSTVTVKDTIKPTAICQNVSVHLGANGTVTVTGASLASGSFDNCAVNSFTPIAKVYNSSNMGPNNLVITVKDVSGNASTCTSVVTVLPPEPPEYQQTSEDRDAALEQLFDDSEGLQMKVFPNPSAGWVTLAFHLEEQVNMTVQVVDLAGRLAISQQTSGQKGANALQMDLSTLGTGIYFINLKSDQFNAQERIMVIQE